MLHIVPDYVYLGTLIDGTAQPASEIRRRFLAVQPMKRLLHKRVFRAPQLPFCTRLMLFQSLVISRLMYGAGAWQALNVLTLRSFCTQVIQLYHFLVPSLKPQEGVSRLDFVARSQQLHPLLLLAKYRISLFDRIAQVDMGELFAVLQHQDSQRSWFQLVCQDLRCMLDIMPDEKIAKLVTAGGVFELVNFSFQHPMVMTQFAKRVAKRFRLYSKIWTVFRSFQQGFAQDCRQAGVTWSHVVPVAQPTQGFTCEECAATFDSFKALCSHVAKQHRKLSIAQYYAASNSCRACLKLYDNRTQVLHHLKYLRTNCLVKLISCCQPLTEEELLEAQDLERQAQPRLKNQQRRKRHVWPMVQAAGPQRPWPWERHASFARADSRPELNPLEDYTEWFAQVFTSLHLDIEDVLAVLCDQPYHGQLAGQLTRMFEAHAMDLPRHIAVEHHLILQEAICLWQDSWLHPSFNPCLPVPMHVASISISRVRIPSPNPAVLGPTLAQQREAHTQVLWNEFLIPVQLSSQVQSEHDKVYQFDSVPRVQLCSAPICLYIFSGRRRLGDFQSFFEEHLAAAGAHAQVLLLDLALSPDHDVGREGLVDMILRWIRTGAVCGVLLAPPCETWSQARYRKGGPYDPRPVRSATHPLALPGLCNRELEQVCVSNLLLFVALRILVTAMMYGIPAIMEHPAEPSRKERPSIWRLPWVRAMFSFGSLMRCCINQAAFGGVSLKPTHLAHCHLPHFEVFLQEDSRPYDLRHFGDLSGQRS